MDLSTSNWTKAQEIKVNECLAKILSSPMFVKAERQQRFLSYIMAETLEGRAEKLKGYTIGVEVFDRETSFDPGIDAIVRVEAARLRTKLLEYYESEGRTDTVRFELPKGKYAIHIDWRGESAIPESPSKADFHPKLIENKPSLAVLPFTNMSSNPEQEYFADGFTDCLITEVSRLSGIFVISRHSSFMYKNAVKSAETIGLELGVRYLLEGSVQRSGEWVRITAQLIDTSTGSQVWAENYDRELKNIFALQDDVTQRITSMLHVRLSGNEVDRFGHDGTASIEAHDALLHGLEDFWLYTQNSCALARLHFENAIRLDPTYAVAYAWLSRTLVCQWIFLWDDHDETLELAFKHAETSVDLDPLQPLAYLVLGWVQCWRKQGEASIAAGRRAVALDPNNADAYFFLAMTLASSDRGEDALRYVKTGMRLNPHPTAFNYLALGFCHLVLENYQEAISAFKRGIEVTDAFISNHVWLCAVYILLDREVEAAIVRNKIMELTGGRKKAFQIIWLNENLISKTNDLLLRAGLM
jgi:adenylate cyclase